MAIDANTTAFSVVEAASYLKLSVESVRKYIQKGRIRPNMTLGNAYLILREECDRFAKTKKPPGNPNFRKKRPTKRGRKRES